MKRVFIFIVFLALLISLSPAQQESAEESGPLFPVSRLGVWGYIDKAGEIAIELQFDFALVFSEGLAVVMVDGKWGYVDKTGKTVIQIMEKSAEKVQEIVG